MDEDEALERLAHIKRLHAEAQHIKGAYTAKIDERNRAIGLLHLENPDAPFSVTEMSRHLGVTYVAVKKIVDSQGVGS